MPDCAFVGMYEHPPLPLICIMLHEHFTLN